MDAWEKIDEFFVENSVDCIVSLREKFWAQKPRLIPPHLIEVHVPREVSGHVFTCYRSFDWSAYTKGSERSCIYVLQVFWLKCLYQGKWTVMYLRVTGLLIEVTVPRVVSVMYLHVTGLLTVIGKGRSHGPFDTYSFVIMCRCPIQKLKRP
jgi:hypothetical protein